MGSRPGVVSAKVELARDKADAYRGINKDRCFTLLVIDDQNTDWSKYFRGKRVQTDWDIKVEQAEFRDITVTANTEAGVTVSIFTTNKAGTRVPRSFKPDFLLVRQNLKDANEDYKNMLLGLQYGGVPSINTLQSIYNFQDRPWVYAHLVNIQQKLGKENFPLIDQTYFPNHKDMTTGVKYPCVFKLGHAHGGLGKVKVENTTSFQDMVSVVAISNSYCTVENYVDAKYDLHVFKIGTNYRALMRKSLSGQWKTNLGQSILEEIPISDRYKKWIDAVSEIFGGLDICSLEAVVAKDGKEYIIEVNDSAAGLLGDSQEEDRRHIADIVFNKMESECKQPREIKPKLEDDKSVVTATSGASGPSRPASAASSSSAAELGKVKQELKEVIQRKEVKAKEIKGKEMKGKEVKEVKEVKKNIVPDPKPRERHDSADSTDSSGSESSSGSDDSSASSTVRKEDKDDREEDGEEEKKPRIGEDGEILEGEDTMKNLRKTFAGIFGELQ
ncbi:synapsin [Eurytemora carolleeae]|uniref:synapsin n=1 Tax=Eurytemora carolleeae TaxID=1294199 RepID=UPI000C7623D8|nr:synapsin [Eurytemora carolleeae]|eukprot:XP_023330999.1 synapsin-like [Eurytemora affinis]